MEWRSRGPAAPPVNTGQAATARSTFRRQGAVERRDVLGAPIECVPFEPCGKPFLVRVNGVGRARGRRGRETVVGVIGRATGSAERAVLPRQDRVFVGE